MNAAQTRFGLGVVMRRLRNTSSGDPSIQQSRTGSTVAMVICVLLGLVLLTDTAFWAGLFFLAGGLLCRRSRADWLIALVAAFYMGHYQLVQDTFGDQGPFVMRNWMAAGFLAGMMLMGAGAHDLLIRRTLAARTRWYLIGLLGLVVLSLSTLSEDSFAARNSPEEYVRVWLVTATAVAGIAVMSSFPLRHFLAWCVALGYLDLLRLPQYVGTAFGTNLSYTLSAGLLGALALFHRRLSLALLLAAPLGVGLVLAGKEGPILATLVGLVAWWVWQGFGSRGRAQRLLVVATLAGSGMVVAWGLRLWGPIRERVLSAGLDVRLPLYQEVLSRVQQSPLIGEWALSPPIPGPIEFFPNATDPLLAYPHAAVLEVLLSWGLIGLTMWLLAQVVTAVPTWKTGLLPLWLTGILFAHSSGDLAGNYTYWVVGAIAICMMLGAKDPPHRPSSAAEHLHPLREEA